MDMNLETEITNTSEEKTLAGKKFGIRALAYAIDVLALYGLNALSGWVFGIGLGIFLGLLKLIGGFTYYLDVTSNRVVNIIIGLIISIVRLM